MILTDFDLQSDDVVDGIFKLFCTNLSKLTYTVLRVSCIQIISVDGRKRARPQVSFLIMKFVFYFQNPWTLTQRCNFLSHMWSICRVSIHLEVVGSNTHKCEIQNIFYIFLVNYTIFVSC